MAMNCNNIVRLGEVAELTTALLTDGAVYEKDKDGNEVLVTVGDKRTTPAMMVWGPAGVGKSATPREIAKKMGIGYVDVRPAQMESCDLRGIGMPDKDTGTVKWFAPDFWPKADDPAHPEYKKGGILVLDELPAAPRDAQVACYEIILDRQIGGGSVYKLPDNWIIIAAGNRAQDRAVSTTMSSALANRMMHFEVEANLDDWMEWALTHDVDPTVVAFLKAVPSLLHKVDDNTNLQRGFPTPRSWEGVSNICKKGLPEAALRIAVNGLVGESAGTQFLQFHKVASQLADVKELMLDPTKPVNVPKEAQLTWAMVSTMVYHVWRGKDAEESKALLDGFLRLVMNLPASFATMAVTWAQKGNASLTGQKASLKMMMCPRYKEYRKKFHTTTNEDTEV